VNGQLHAPAALPPEKVLVVRIRQKVVWTPDPRAGLDDVEKWKFLTLPGLKLRLLSCPTVTILTMLPLLILSEDKIENLTGMSMLEQDLLPHSLQFHSHSHSRFNPHVPRNWQTLCILKKFSQFTYAFHFWICNASYCHRILQIHFLDTDFLHSSSAVMLVSFLAYSLTLKMKAVYILL
jgi:hypothetical protein